MLIYSAESRGEDVVFLNFETLFYEVLGHPGVSFSLGIPELGVIGDVDGDIV